jgi:hypothetical protein
MEKCPELTVQSQSVTVVRGSGLLHRWFAVGATGQSRQTSFLKRVLGIPKRYLRGFLLRGIIAGISWCSSYDPPFSTVQRPVCSGAMRQTTERGGQNTYKTPGISAFLRRGYDSNFPRYHRCVRSARGTRLAAETRKSHTPFGHGKQTMANPRKETSSEKYCGLLTSSKSPPRGIRYLWLVRARCSPDFPRILDRSRRLLNRRSQSMVTERPAAHKSKPGSRRNQREAAKSVSGHARHAPLRMPCGTVTMRPPSETSIEYPESGAGRMSNFRKESDRRGAG